MKVEATELDIAQVTEMVVWALAKDRENKRREKAERRTEAFHRHTQHCIEEFERYEKDHQMRLAHVAEEKWNRWYRKMARRFGWPTHE